MNRIRVVLADDHALVRAGTKRILEAYPDIEVVGGAVDCEQVLQMIRRLHADVAILDIRMAALNGIEVVRRIREVGLDTRALMLTAYDDDDYILALMEVGALGYILKTAKGNDLAEAVRRIYRGEPVLHPAIAMKVARLWAGQRAASQHNTVEQLTQREREILEMIAKGLRTREIADRLCISTRTVEGHVNSILSKLGVSSRLEAVLYALSHHWISLEEVREWGE